MQARGHTGRDASTNAWMHTCALGANMQPGTHIHRHASHIGTRMCMQAGMHASTLGRHGGMHVCSLEDKVATIEACMQECLLTGTNWA